MKKQLLLGSALFAALIAYPQSSQMKKGNITGVSNMAEKFAQKFTVTNNPNESQSIQGAKNSPAQAVNSEITFATPEGGGAVASPTVQWKAIGGSMNIYGVLVSQTKPLHFNKNVNAISFIHRKGTSSTTSPFSTTGSIMARISTNWGTTWDSTCVWASDDAIKRARYPQGGIYTSASPATGTNINNAYVTVMGPLTNGTGWMGNYYASKQLGSANYNFTASPTGGAMQTILNTPPYNAGLAKHDFSRYSFTSTDDGLVRSIAGRYTGIDGNGQPNGFRGAAVVKGTFNAGTFTWTSDTIIPATIQSTLANNNIFSEPIMAWNEAGTHGYVMFIGADNTYSANLNTPNRGWQPIVYKTTNSGGSWAQIAGIDFAAPAFSTAVLDHCANVGGSTLTIPWVNLGEGYDMVVDANNKVHIACTMVGAAKAHGDSLTYSWQFGAQKYGFSHTPGLRPYVYDFTGDGAGPWTVTVIDSLSSEEPGASSTAPGYTSNPWDPDPANQNAKVGSSSRIQLGRDVSGQYILYSWAESDTAFTNGQEKWNTLPNIKARCMLVTPGGSTLSPTEVNVTKPNPVAAPNYTQNANVANRAMFHYMSTTGMFHSCVGSNTVVLNVPFSVTNSNPYAQLTENRHWVTNSRLEFGGLTNCTGFQQNLAHNVNGIEIYPNPASTNATVAVDLKEKGNVLINVYNMVGQLMQTTNVNGELGVNKVDVNFSNLSAGMYIVNVKVGNTTSTKKLIIE